MMARKHENLFPLLEELHIGQVAFSPLANGFLTGQYRKGMTFDKEYDYRSALTQFKEESFEKNQQLLAFLNELAFKKMLLQHKFL